MTLSLNDVTVVSVTYKSQGVMGTMAKTLAQFPHVIVVDNASHDGTAEAVARQVPHAQLIANADNLGFGQANNQAVAEVKTPFALLLNPDCEISPSSVLALLERMTELPSVAIAAPQGWCPDGTPQMAYRHAFFEKVPRQPYQVPQGPVSAKWLHGCCLLVRVDVFRSFGGFDKRFFLYYEDDDLCLQTLKAGYECICEPAATALHQGGASSQPTVQVLLKKHFNYLRSRHLAIEKYLGWPRGMAYLLQMMLGSVIAVPLYALLLRKQHLVKWLAWGAAAWRGFAIGLLRAGPYR